MTCCCSSAERNPPGAITDLSMPAGLGPDVFPVYRHILRTSSASVPIVAAVLITVELAGGASYIDSLIGGIGGAFSTGVHLAFWVTLTFVVLERAEVAAHVISRSNGFQIARHLRCGEGGIRTREALADLQR